VITEVFLAGYGTVTGYGGGALTSYDAASYSNPVNLGTIPEGATQRPFLAGIGNNLLGMILSSIAGERVQPEYGLCRHEYCRLFSAGDEHERRK
jgi:hypothetical protein